MDYINVKGVAWAYTQVQIPSAQRFVLITIAKHANNDGQCFPSNKTLASETGYTERYISEAIKFLEKSGCLVVNRQPGKSSTFQIIFESTTPEQHSEVPPNDVHPRTTFTPERSSGDPRTTFGTTPEQHSEVPPNDVHPNNKINNKEEESMEKNSLPSTDVEGADADASAKEREENTETSTSKKKPKTRDDYDPEYVEFAEKYQAAVLKKHGNLAPPITESLICQCAETIDRCVRIDKISFEELKGCLRWAFNDDFWGDKLRSLTAIRSTSKSNGCKKIQNAMTEYKNSLQASAHVQRPTQTSPQQPTQQPATPTEWQYRQQEQRLQVDKYFQMKEELERLERLEQEEDVEDAK